MKSVGTRTFFLFYRLLFMPIAVSLAMTVGLLSKKVRLGLSLRLHIRKKRKQFATRPIWIHASSGEFEYAKPLIRALKSRHPTIPILVTYYSPSYRKRIAEFPGVDHAEPLPLDLPGPVHDFLKFYRPRAALFSRTDLWPELLLQTKQKKIPSLLFSCTRPAFTGTRRLVAPFYSMLYDLMDEIHCVSEEDQQNLLNITKTPVSVKGDTRYDQVSHRLQTGPNLSNSLNCLKHQGDENQQPVILMAGSTWPQDEKVLIPALTDFIKKGQLRLVIAPHEPTPVHLARLQKQLNERYLTYSLFSQTTPSTADILIVDKVGVLADLYRFADVAFIGGSFRRKVHSVMEALGTGRPVLVGPHFRNNREAVEFQDLRFQNMQAVTVVKNEEEIQDWFQLYFKLDPITRRGFEQRIQSGFEERQGATERVLEWLRPLENVH